MCSLLFSKSRQTPHKACSSKYVASHFGGLYICPSYFCFCRRLQSLAFFVAACRRAATGGFCWQAGKF